MRPKLALAALLAGLVLTALLSALTARFLLLLAGFLLIWLRLAALLAALIWIVGHWKRLLIAGQPRKLSTNRRPVGSGHAVGTFARFEINASQEPMRFPEYK